jgi:hypothetical protein
LRFAEALQAGTLISPESLAEATSPQGEAFADVFTLRMALEASAEQPSATTALPDE